MFDCKFKSTGISWYRNGRRRKLNDAAECLWHALKDCSDKWGAIEGDEDDLVHALFSGRPDWTVAKMRASLALLVDVGLIALYESDGDPWIEVLRHDENQSTTFLSRRGVNRMSPERFGNGANSRQMTTNETVVDKGCPVIDSGFALAGANGNGDTPNGVRPKRVPAPTPEEVGAAIESSRTKLGSLATHVDDLVAIMAAENKTGTVAATRALRELWKPIGAFTQEIEPRALQHGLQAAVEAGAPNKNYVKKAAAGYSKRGFVDHAAQSNGNGNGVDNGYRDVKQTVIHL